MIHVLMAILILLPSQSGGCGNGQSCAGVPWSPVQLPILNSPTPFATLGAFTPTPTDVSGSVLPTATGVAINDLGGSLSTMNAVMNATAIPLTNQFATPDTVTLQSSTTFLNYAVGLQSIHLGFMQPLLVFTLSTFGLTVTTSVLIIMLPVIVKIYGAFRKIVSTIADLLPG